jgi:hypothetical protein
MPKFQKLVDKYMTMNNNNKYSFAAIKADIIYFSNIKGKNKLLKFDLNF